MASTRVCATLISSRPTAMYTPDPCISLHTLVELNFPKIDGLEFEPWSFNDMPWSEGICVEIALTVWMEEAFLVTVQNSR